MSEPLRHLANPSHRQQIVPRKYQQHMSSLAGRLRRFSYWMIALTLALGATLLTAGLVVIAGRLVIIWVGCFCLLIGVRAIVRRSDKIVRFSVWFAELQLVSTAFYVAVSGFAGVAGAFILEGVPFASGLVLFTAAISTALVLLAGAR